VLLKCSCKGRQALFNVVMGLKSAIVKGDDTELDLMTLNFTGHVNWQIIPGIFMCTGLLSRRAAAVGIRVKESWTFRTDICRPEGISRLGICNPAQEPAVGIWQKQASVKNVINFASMKSFNFLIEYYIWYVHHYVVNVGQCLKFQIHLG